MSTADQLRMAGVVIHSVFLYAALTEDGFVKVGISRVPFERIYSVHTGSPSPVRAAQWTWIGSMNIARRIELQLKQDWKARRTRGEWYRFDYSKPEEKREFHDTLNVMVEHFTRDKPSWQRLGPKQVAELITAARERERQKGTRKARHPWDRAA